MKKCWNCWGETYILNPYYYFCRDCPCISLTDAYPHEFTPTHSEILCRDERKLTKETK
jgi:hypothetical protein